MDAKHTPGPWFVGASTGPNCARIETENGAQVAAVTVQSFVTVKQGQPVYEWSDEGYANALLIASAPETAVERNLLKEINAELLEALEDILGSCRRNFSSGRNGENEYRSVYAKHFAAIAKATE